MCHVTKYSTILGVFQHPWPGFSLIRHFERGEGHGDKVGSWAARPLSIRDCGSSLADNLYCCCQLLASSLFANVELQLPEFFCQLPWHQCPLCRNKWQRRKKIDLILLLTFREIKENLLTINAWKDVIWSAYSRRFVCLCVSANEMSVKG